MQIRIVSDIAALMGSVAGRLGELGYEVEQTEDYVDSCELRYSKSAPIDQLTPLINHLKPFLPRIVLTDDLDDVDAEIVLGDTVDLDSVEILTKTTSQAYSQQLNRTFLELGFRSKGVEQITSPDHNLLYGGASQFARQVVRWYLQLDGIEVTENKSWGDDDDDIYLSIPTRSAEAMARGTSPTAINIVLEGDDFGQLLQVQNKLEGEGFESIEMRPFDDRGDRRFELLSGGLGANPEMLGKVRDIVTQVMEDAGVDMESCPLKQSPSDELEVVIRLPLGAHHSGELAAYAGTSPTRWNVILRTNEPRAIEPLSARLRDAGFTRLTIEGLTENTIAPRILWGAVAMYEEVAEEFKSIVEAGLGDVDGYGSTTPFVVDKFGTEDSRIMIDVPATAVPMTPGSGPFAPELIEACGNWECKVYTNNPRPLRPLNDALRSLHFKDFEIDDDDDPDELIIKYGGAPPELVSFVAGMVEHFVGERPRTSCVWGESDDDIWIYIPRDEAEDAILHHEESSNSPDAPDLQAWFAREEGGGKEQPFVALGADELRVGHVRVKRRVLSERDAAMIPDADKFKTYCVDQRTAETLLHIVESVFMREPCLLEGETSVSKTSIIEYAAMLLRQPLVRLNLNGQTDTGELVGRFVPNDDVDSQHPWRWQDGLVIEAMKRGWWVVLDELNLAEPQILERLNSILERHPSVILTEYDNSVVGYGGTPVHESFRIFATMNPAEYAGRSPLSPAYRDRWRGYRYVNSPGEPEYRAMLSFMITGRHPDVTLFGESYVGGQQEAPYPSLAKVPNVMEFLAAVARFHATLEGATVRASGGARLGARRRERYVFTRRGLLALIEYLHKSLHGEHTVMTMRAALARYYISRLASSQDQSTVLRLLDAAGIGPNTWTIGQTDEAEGDD